MTQADEMRQFALTLVGEEYTWGDEPWFTAGSPVTSDPYDTDCSGLVFGCFRKVGVRWKNGALWPRLTANGYKHNAVLASTPYRVGDVACFWNSEGRAYHIALYVGDNETVEARGRAWGVVRYKLDDPVNGVIHRHDHMMRFNWVNLGELHPDRPELQRGDSGPFVVELATLLNNAGWTPPLKKTGFFGFITENAVEWFQIGHDLEVDGIVGDLTWAELLTHSEQ